MQSRNIPQANQTLIKCYNKSVEQEPFMQDQIIPPTQASLSTPFPGWIRLTETLRDTNQAGPYDGLYARAANHQTIFATFKQERRAGKILVANMLGAGVGGALLQRLYAAIGVDPNRYNKVGLVRTANENGITETSPDKTGQHFYVQSIFVPGYQEEFWKFAYREYYKKIFSQQIKSADITFINEATALLLEYYQSEYDTHKKMLQAAKDRQAELSLLRTETGQTILEENINKYQKRLNFIRRLFPGEIDILNVNAHVQTQLQYHPKVLAEELANAKLNQISAMDGSDIHNQELITNTLKSNETLLKDFTRLVAPRLLVGDFAVHSGNFGIVEQANKAGDKELHLVAINFNAACKNLMKYLNPFQQFTARDVQIKNEEGDKNYYIEYGKEIRSSLEMAQAFIELGNIDKKQTKQMISAAISEQLFYDGDKRTKHKFSLSIIREFCKRIGMQYDK